MVRQLKHHEHKLLKKVDFLNVSRPQSSSLHRLTSSTVEAGRKSTRSQSHPSLSYPEPRRLHKVHHNSPPIPAVCSSSKNRYNKLCGSIRSFAHRLSLLPPRDPVRVRMEAQILSKLYDMGILGSTSKLSEIESKLTVASICRRRLSVVMSMSKMAETISSVSLRHSLPPFQCQEPDCY